MQINWKLRLKNKGTLAAIISAAVVFVYSVLAALGVTPAIAQDTVMAAATALLTILTALGIVIDPTTDGLGDSERAMGYDEPHVD